MISFRSLAADFGGGRVDDAISAKMLRTVSPLAIATAEEAGRMLKDEGKDRLRSVELELLVGDRVNGSF